MRVLVFVRPILAALIAILIIAPLADSVSAQVDDAVLADQLALVDLDGLPGALTVSVYEPDGTVSFASVGENVDGSDSVPTDHYRIGSITKMFTATLVLSLVEDGEVDLDQAAATYISRIPVPADITVRQLLNHTSGLPDYVGLPDAQQIVLNNPAKVWTPEEIWALVAGKPFAEPGQYRYSSTNYILLGVLIEEMTGQTYAQVLRDRILDQVGLEDTYLASFETGPEPVEAVMSLFGRYLPVLADYTAIATAGWAAGGLVSTGADLDRFMTALFADQIITADSLDEMTDIGPSNYGLGIETFPDTPMVYGHGGLIPGYSTLLVYAVQTGRTAFWTATNEDILFGETIEPILELVTQP